jgi:hypothetical protein
LPGSNRILNQVNGHPTEIKTSRGKILIYDHKRNMLYFAFLNKYLRPAQVRNLPLNSDFVNQAGNGCRVIFFSWQ